MDSSRSSNPIAGQPFLAGTANDSSRPIQIFGNYAPDGTLLQPVLPGPAFGDDFGSFGFEDNPDQGDAKRRRIARACDSCRKKKIRCNGQLPTCSHCENYKTDCVYTHVEKKRAPQKGAKYIEGLENRLGRMESLLKMSGLLDKDDESSTDLRTLEQRLSAQQNHSSRESPTNANNDPGSISQAMDSRLASPNDTSRQQGTNPSPQMNVASPASEGSRSQVDARTETDVEALSELMCSLVTNQDGEARYIGSCSGFSIFSPKGVQWVNDKIGDQSFLKMIAKVDHRNWYNWRPEVFDDIFERKIYKTLPQRDECFQILGDFFSNLGTIFPLYHEPSFMDLVEQQYTTKPPQDVGWWASLNVTLALGCRIRSINDPNPGENDRASWLYFKNALAVQSTLTLRNTDLLSLQALLGMALFSQGTPNPQPSIALVASALRSAHNMGLHKRASVLGPSRSTLNLVNVEQRRRVFWIAYQMDKELSLRSGRPPIQDDDDMNVELPSSDPDDGVGNVLLANGDKVNIFRLSSTFAVIQSKVYKRLYSVKALRQSDGELLNTIGELDAELERWKDEIPIDFRPDHEIQISNSSLAMHIVALHLAYYYCLTTIHRMSVHHGFWSSRLSDFAIQGLNVRPLNPRVFSSAALCVAAARASINLIRLIPRDDFTCFWLISYYPITALVTLFAHILQNPLDARARSDIRLMHIVVDCISNISEEDTSGSLKRILITCSEFERIANMALSKAERDLSTRQKRKKMREREKIERQEETQNQVSQGSLYPIPNVFTSWPETSNNVAAPQNFSTGVVAGLQQLSSSGGVQIAENSHEEPNYNSNRRTQSSWHSNEQSSASALAVAEELSQPNGFNLPAFSSHDSVGRIESMSTAVAESIADHDGTQQLFASHEFWNMPMTFPTFDWVWTDMSGNSMDESHHNST